MCDTIEFAARLLHLSALVTANVGKWLTHQDILNYWEEKTGILETENHIAGVMNALCRNDDHVVMRGKTIRFETETLRAHRLYDEELVIFNKKKDQQAQYDAKRAKDLAKVQALRAEADVAAAAFVKKYATLHAA
jgi:hypothetical protein